MHGEANERQNLEDRSLLNRDYGRNKIITILIYERIMTKKWVM